MSTRRPQVCRSATTPPTWSAATTPGCEPRPRRISQAFNPLLPSVELQHGAGSVVVSRDLAMVTTWVQIPASALLSTHHREQSLCDCEHDGARRGTRFARDDGPRPRTATTRVRRRSVDRVAERHPASNRRRGALAGRYTPVRTVLRPGRPAHVGAVVSAQNVAEGTAFTFTPGCEFLPPDSVGEIDGIHRPAYRATRS